MIPDNTGIAGAAAIPSADPLLKLRTVSGDVRPPEEMPRPPRPSEDDAPSDMAREGAGSWLRYRAYRHQLRLITCKPDTD